MSELTRQSVYFTEPRRLTVRSEPLAQPAAGQVLVRTLISAISPGSELLVYRGQAPADIDVDEAIEALNGEFKFPIKYGYAAVGRVITLGEGVDEHWQGRLVFAFNPHESHFLASANKLIPVPPGLAPEDAIFLPNMETAVTFMLDGAPLIGERVVVFGQGIVGLLTTALLARYPLFSLVTFDHYPLRRETSATLGANASIDPLAPAATERLAALLKDKRRYAGADLTYELSGNPKALDQALSITGFDGRIVVGSWYGKKRAELDLGGRFHRTRLHIISSQVSTLAPHLAGRWNKPRRLRTAWNMIKELMPARLITHRFNIWQADQAYKLLDENPEQSIQVIFTYD